MSDEASLVPSGKQFLADLVAGRQDVIKLGGEHGLDETALARWINDPQNARCLDALCKLADMQTQLTLSRFRSMAVSRLAKIASDESEKSETARRASVDLLKVDLKRTEVEPAEPDSDDAIPSPQSLYGIDLRLTNEEHISDDAADETFDDGDDDDQRREDA